jgi:hypothetical protein
MRYLRPPPVEWMMQRAESIALPLSLPPPAASVKVVVGHGVDPEEA